MRKRTIFLWVLPFLLFCLLGLGCLSFPGYSFSAYICFGIAALCLCYFLLFVLLTHRKRLARILLWALTGLLCAGLVLALVTGCIIADAAKGEDASACDYVIVLGAGVNGTQPSLILSERIGRAYTYLTDNPQVIGVLSGGQGPGEDITEAQCMYDRLTAMGIDPERLLLEDKSTSTRENIRFSLDVLEAQTGQRPAAAAIISNEFHLYRAGLFAAEQGLEAVGVPAETTWLSLRINYFLREILAVWYYTLLGG